MDIRRFIQSSAGKAVLFAGIILLAGAIVYSVAGFFGESALARRSRQRTYIDAATGKPFVHELRLDDRTPILAPSGQKTGYPAEFCWWTRDGKVRSEPYPVLLNRYAGKPGATFCPDCGRLVVPQNPPASPNEPPPPTESQYRQNRGAAQAAP